MKMLSNWLKDSYSQTIQFLCLLVAFLLPSALNLQSVIPVPDGFDLNLFGLAEYLAIKGGNIGIGILLVGVSVVMLHKRNRSKTLNKGNAYHTHGMTWYRFCSKVLGYGACSLVRVPIAMQFLLVLNDTFETYDYGDVYEELDADSNVRVSRYSAAKGAYSSGQAGWVSLVISDTYPIEFEQLPPDRGKDIIIAISRLSNQTSRVRRYSRHLVDTVTTVVRDLPPGSRVNVFATTNPKNTYEIIDKAFKLGGRDNLNALYVYRQHHCGAEDNWDFTDPVKIYDRLSGRQRQ